MVIFKSTRQNRERNQETQVPSGEMSVSCAPKALLGLLYSPFSFSGNDQNRRTGAIHTRMNLINSFMHTYCYTQSNLADMNLLPGRVDTLLQQLFGRGVSTSRNSYNSI